MSLIGLFIFDGSFFIIKRRSQRNLKDLDCPYGRLSHILRGGDKKLAKEFL